MLYFRKKRHEKLHDDQNSAGKDQQMSFGKFTQFLKTKPDFLDYTVRYIKYYWQSQSDPDITKFPRFKGKNCRLEPGKFNLNNMIIDINDFDFGDRLKKVEFSDIESEGSEPEVKILNVIEKGRKRASEQWVPNKLRPHFSLSSISYLQ